MSGVRVKCCVPGCPTRYGSSRLSLFRFPTSQQQERLEAFISFVDSEDVRGKTALQLRSMRICELHFCGNVIRPGGKMKKLEPYAVPTIKISSSLDSKDCIEPIIFPENKHVPTVGLHSFNSLAINSGGNEVSETCAGIGIQALESVDSPIFTTPFAPSVSSTPQVHLPSQPSKKVRITLFPDTTQVEYNAVPGPSSVDLSNASFDSGSRGACSSSNINSASSFSTPTVSSEKIATTEICHPKRKRDNVLSEFPFSRRHLTPKKSKRLYIKLLKTVADLKKKTKKYNASKQLVKDLKQLTRNPGLLVETSLSTTLKLLVTGELENRSRPKNGRRWTRKQKILALTMLKRGPKLYRYLEMLMCLPSRNTLTALLREVDFQHGILKPVMEAVRVKVNSMSAHEKWCAISFDEMSIRECLSYDQHSDQIQGYQETDKRYCLVANHALVFMVRSLVGDWKFPIAYYFLKDSVPAATMASLITDVVRAVVVIGLHPVATVCDQGSPNVGVLNHLKKKTGNPGPYINVDGKKLFVFFDPPHLLKSIRNNLLKYDLQFADGLVKWSYIEKAISLDQNFLQICHKITPTHLNPVGKAKMKVKYASQIFSHSMYCAIAHLVETGKLPEEAKATANFVKLMDQLFDSFNSCSTSTKPLGRLLTNNSKHITFWDSIIKDFNNIKFVNKTTHALVTNPPCLMGWVDNIRAMKSLWSHLQSISPSFQKFNIRKINQDPLENFFSSVRQCSGCNDNPTTTQFTDAVKTISINWFSNIAVTTGNCEKDSDQLLTLIDSILESSTEKRSGAHIPPLQELTERECEARNAKNFCLTTKDKSLLSLNLSQDEVTGVVCTYNTLRQTSKNTVNPAVTDNDVTLNANVYVSGFIIKKLKESKKSAFCQSCLNSLETSEKTSIHSFLSMKEYNVHKDGLKYPSLDMAQYVLEVSHSMLRKSDAVFHLTGLSEKLQNIALKTNPWITCHEHQHSLAMEICKIVSIILIYRKCKILNRILKAKTSRKNNRRRIEIFQHQ